MTDFTDADALDEAAAIDELTGLMDSGLSQYEASRAMWSPCPIFEDLTREVAGHDARIRVRVGMADVLAWLRRSGRAA